MKKATARTTIVIVLLVVAVVGYYAYLANKSHMSKAETSMTFVETTLSRDLTKDYPPTPKEVIKYYNEILRCLYNEESTAEEVSALTVKMRELYDDDLLAINELGTHQMLLQAEIADWKKNGRRYISFSPASSTDVDTYEYKGRTCAKIACAYAITQEGRNYQISQIYILRRDENKHWKILGWRDESQIAPAEE